jgi:3-oxoadipate enol-lactonase
MNPTRTTVVVAGSAPVRLSVIDVAPTAPVRGTMVFVHGAGGCAEQWLPQVTCFARNYRVVAFDLRGHGQSEAPRSAYTLEEFLWDFTQLLDRLEIREPFLLMAHSFGGPIALTFTAAQPHRVARLTLVATAPEIHLHPVLETVLKLPIPLTALERLRPILAPKLHAPLFVIKRVLAGTLFPWRGWDLLPQITTPTLIIGGQFDFIVPTSALQRMHRLLPDSQLEIIRYARHLPQLERPKAVNRAIERFIGVRRSWRGDIEGEDVFWEEGLP